MHTPKSDYLRTRIAAKQHCTPEQHLEREIHEYYQAAQHHAALAANYLEHVQRLVNKRQPN